MISRGSISGNRVKVIELLIEYTLHSHIRAVGDQLNALSLYLEQAGDVGREPRDHFATHDESGMTDP